MDTEVVIVLVLFSMKQYQLEVLHVEVDDLWCFAARKLESKTNEVMPV